jgi:MoxR-like ATPase
MPGTDPGDVYGRLVAEVGKRIAGQRSTLELMIIAMVANGHALLEGVPGVAKTTMTKSLAEAVQADFGRIQGTPDLEPRDIVGYTYLDEGNNVKIKEGPIFTNILLVDELNRMQPRTMSALLESLGELQVTLGESTHALPKPFIAFATQNPLKIEGTEPIPKVLADRFLMKIDVEYPSMEEEQEMLRIKEAEAQTTVNKVIGTQELMQLQRMAKEQVKMPDEIAGYVTRVVDATRKDMHAIMGASPRADIAFMQCGKARALLQGRSEVSKDDIRFLARPVLSHRIAVRSTGGIGVHGIIDGILATLG